MAFVTGSMGCYDHGREGGHAFVTLRIEPRRGNASADLGLRGSVHSEL